MATNEPPLISVDSFGEIIILRIQADAINDHHNSGRFRDELKAVLAQRSSVVVDLGQVDYLSSTGSGELVRIHFHTTRIGGRIIFCRLTPVVRDLLRVNKLDRMFQIVSSLGEAMAALDWSLAIDCPIAGCEGDGLCHEPSIADRGGELCCRSCGCRFRVEPFRLSPSGEARVTVSWFEIPTYEHEQVHGELGAIVKVRITGRLDLFAAESLVDAWRSLPGASRALLDLSAATELSSPGLRFLEEQVRASSPIDRFVVVVDPDRSDRTRAVLSIIRVATTQEEAMSILRGSRAMDETPTALWVSALLTRSK